MRRALLKRKALVAALTLVFTDASSFDSRIAIGRSSHATYFDSQGRLAWAPNNMVRNSVAAGAATGTPGTAPTNWGLIGNANGISTSIVGVGTDASSGFPYVEIRVSGTATANQTAGIDFDGTTFATAAIGQTWVVSSHIAIVSGTMPLRSIDMVLFERSSGGGSLVAATSDVRGTLNSTLQRFSLARTLTNASTAYAQGSCRVTLFSGESCDVTLRIAAPQLELTTQTIPGPYKSTSGSAYYGPRIDYSPSTLAARGLLVEESRTNLNTNSALLGAGTGGTVATGTSYCGFVMTRFTADGTTVAHAATANSALTPAASTAVALSAVVRSVSGTGYCQLTGSSAWIGDSTFSYANFNLNTGVVTQTGSAATNARIEDIGGGYYRISCSITTSAAPASGTALAVFMLNTGMETRSPNLANANVIECGLMQHEVGGFATAIIPTYAGATTRAADIYAITDVALIDQNKGSLLSEFETTDSATLATVVCIGTITSNVSFFIREGSALNAFVNTIRLIPGGLWVNKTKAVLTYNTDGRCTAKSYPAGALVSSTTTNTALTRMTIGSGTNNTRQLNGWIKSVRYWPYALSDAEINRLM